ncbi:MAG: hypothetical protein K1X47_17510 [Cyclobacteriaceae bacterium]|nr:hypothetical protein [Cyclobacteriaceae bacterium]
MKDVALLIGWLLLGVQTLDAQVLKPSRKIATVNVQGVTRVSVDRLGNFYFVLGDGAIVKYDPDGKELARYTASQTTPLTLLEAWNPLRVFAYYRDRQEYRTLDRFLTEQAVAPLDPAFAIDPYLMCPSIDNNGWILDTSDLSLKKVNLSGAIVMLDFMLKLSGVPESPEFVHMREYQNMVFLLDRKSGLYVLNNIGKQIDFIEAVGVNAFAFSGEDLYYQEGDRLRFIDLYTKETHEVQLEGIPLFTLATDERLVVVREKEAVFYEFANP